MAEAPLPVFTMPDRAGIIALDLDGTLLNSNKELSAVNLAALERAANAGFEIVPTTGRFYSAMPESVRKLPFVRYAITINGAQVSDLSTGEVLFRAELPLDTSLEIMTYLDTLPVIYDCFCDNGGFMTESMKLHIDEMASDPHYRKMLRELRRSVPELKAFLRCRGKDVQKIQFFTNRPDLRQRLLSELPRRFKDICVSSSVSDNVEINQLHANKGEALMALAEHLGLEREQTIAFGDGLNDISMLEHSGIGVAMANACQRVKDASDYITTSCDEDGVARGIAKFCFGEE